jgi:hypothetical protein
MTITKHPFSPDTSGSAPRSAIQNLALSVILVRHQTVTNLSPQNNGGKLAEM